MNDETTTAAPAWPRRGRLAFRRWRHGRPFWGGLWTMLAGIEILSIPLAPLSVIIHQGIAGVSSELIGALLVLMGLFMWFAPAQRQVAGVVAIVLSLTSFITSNFGGFLLGLLLGLVGGALGFAWVPDRHGFTKRRAPWRRAAAEDETPALSEGEDDGRPEGDVRPEPPARRTPDDGPRPATS